MDPFNGGGNVNWAVAHGKNPRNERMSDTIEAESEWKRIVTASLSCVSGCSEGNPPSKGGTFESEAL